MKKNIRGFSDEFCIVKHPKLNAVILTFISKDFNTSFEISMNEWHNLKNFLRKSRTSMHLPDHTQGYQGFDIKKNKPSFYNLDSWIENIKFFTKKFNNMANGEDFIKKEIKKEKSKSKTIAKTLLDENIYLILKNTTIHVSREKFIRLCTFVLKN